MPQTFDFDFEKIRKQAKTFTEEGLRILRQGVQGAGVMAEATVDVTKHHVQTRRSQIELYQALHDLGAKLYEKIGDSEPHKVELSPAMHELCRKLRKLQQTIVASEKHLDHVSVVGKKPRKVKIVVKKKKAKKR